MLTKHREDRLQAMLCISNTTGLWARPPLCRARATREGRGGGWEISEGTISGARWTVHKTRKNPSIGNPISLGLRKKKSTRLPSLDTTPTFHPSHSRNRERRQCRSSVLQSPQEEQVIRASYLPPPPPGRKYVCLTSATELEMI